MTKHYALVVKDDSGGIIFARTWGVVSDSPESYLDAESLSAFAYLLQKEAAARHKVKAAT